MQREAAQLKQLMHAYLWNAILFSAVTASHWHMAAEGDKVISEVYLLLLPGSWNHKPLIVLMNNKFVLKIHLTSGQRRDSVTTWPLRLFESGGRQPCSGPFLRWEPTLHTQPFNLPATACYNPHGSDLHKHLSTWGVRSAIPICSTGCFYILLKQSWF